MDRGAAKVKPASVSGGELLLCRCSFNRVGTLLTDHPLLTFHACRRKLEVYTSARLSSPSAWL